MAQEAEVVFPAQGPLKEDNDVFSQPMSFKRSAHPELNIPFAQRKRKYFQKFSQMLIASLKNVNQFSKGKQYKKSIKKSSVIRSDPVQTTSSCGRPLAGFLPILEDSSQRQMGSINSQSRLYPSNSNKFPNLLSRSGKPVFQMRNSQFCWKR